MDCFSNPGGYITHNATNHLVPSPNKITLKRKGSSVLRCGWWKHNTHILVTFGLYSTCDARQQHRPGTARIWPSKCDYTSLRNTLSWPVEATGPQQSGTRPFCVIALMFPLRHLLSEQRPALVRSQVLWSTTYWALEDLLCLEELFKVWFILDVALKSRTALSSCGFNRSLL